MLHLLLNFLTFIVSLSSQWPCKVSVIICILQMKTQLVIRIKLALASRREEVTDQDVNSLIKTLLQSILDFAQEGKNPGISYILLYDYVSKNLEV